MRRTLLWTGALAFLGVAVVLFLSSQDSLLQINGDAPGIGAGVYVSGRRIGTLTEYVYRGRPLVGTEYDMPRVARDARDTVLVTGDTLATAIDLHVFRGGQEIELRGTNGTTLRSRLPIGRYLYVTASFARRDIRVRAEK
ncbi:MAG TPA: hypothetical protein VMK12_32675 [Anaeromyxobacteraceae bacterium]|nr:hypothetical protein [Anaeromyxobacteraceae bacterium]